MADVVDWDAMPEQVRGRLTDLAARALDDIPPGGIPKPLRPVTKFAPAKRARTAAPALWRALANGGAFRSAVTEWAREYQPDALELSDADPVASAAAAVLLESPDAPKLIDAAAERAGQASLRAQLDAALGRIERLSDELAKARQQLSEQRAAARSERDEEVDRLRARLRERGVELREARQAAQRADAEPGAVTSETTALTARLERERQRADAERARADRAVADVAAARRSAREARQADEVRIALLLDTMAGVVAGLRSELALAGAAPGEGRPADTVPGASHPGQVPPVVQDGVLLARLLALPGAHLIVDGYNVTKTGYPDLTLAQQRERLGNELAALSARTSAEVTVVFDGAGVVAVPVATTRGVRVLFSDPGVSADDVIIQIVAVEPPGRPLIVATSDREIIDSVRSRGAYPVPSALLLTQLGRV